MRQMKLDESTAALRRMYFDCRDVDDGITPETGEADGQPQISVNGASWTNTGISTLTHIGNGRYYATLDASLSTAGAIIKGRYKSANTAETPAEEDIVLVDFKPYSLPTEIDTLLTANHGTGSWQQVAVISACLSSSQNEGGEIDLEITAAVDWSQGFKLTGWSADDWTAITLTIKADENDEDSNALVCIRLSNPGAGDDGQLVLRGISGSSIDASWGSLAIATGVPGEVTITPTIAAAGLDIPPSPSDAPYLYEITEWDGAVKRTFFKGGLVVKRPVRRSLAAP